MHVTLLQGVILVIANKRRKKTIFYLFIYLKEEEESKIYRKVRFTTMRTTGKRKADCDGEPPTNQLPVYGDEILVIEERAAPGETTSSGTLVLSSIQNWASCCYVAIIIIVMAILPWLGFPSECT